MSTKLPSIPDPRPTLEGLHTTVMALTQAMRLLILNANNQGNAQVFTGNAAFARGLAGSSALAAEASSAATAASAAATAAQTAAQAASADANSVRSAIGSIPIIVGVDDGTRFIPEAILVNGVSRTVELDGSMMKASSIDYGSIAPGSVTLESYEAVTGTSASGSLLFPTTGTLLLWAAFVGPAVSTPGGTGALIITVDGTDTTVAVVPVVGGNALPVAGFLLSSGLVEGAHTFSCRAEFTTGPTDLANVSIMALAVFR